MPGENGTSWKGQIGEEQEETAEPGAEVPRTQIEGPDVGDLGLVQPRPIGAILVAATGQAREALLAQDQ